MKKLIDAEEVKRFLDEFTNNEYSTREECEMVELMIRGIEHFPDESRKRLSAAEMIDLLKRQFDVSEIYARYMFHCLIRFKEFEDECKNHFTV